MKKIFTENNVAKVGYYKSVLESNGIEAYVKNETLSSCMGAVPVIDVWPELWVINDEDAEKAIAILDKFESGSEA